MEREHVPSYRQGVCLAAAAALTTPSLAHAHPFFPKKRQCRPIQVATVSVCLLQRMHLELAHAHTISAVAQKVKTLQKAKPFPQFQIFILEVLITLLKKPNQMLLSGGLIFYLHTARQQTLMHLARPDVSRWTALLARGIKMLQKSQPMPLCLCNRMPA